MNFDEVMKEAKPVIGKYCKVCPVCNGRACKNQIPGPGAKGVGDTAIRNYDAWQEIRLNMDTIAENKAIDTTCGLFGQEFSLPVFAGPVGAVNLHYGEKYNDAAYNEMLVAACAKKGIAAFTGDGVDAEVMRAAAAAVKAGKGCGIPTVKPWNVELVEEKLRLVKESGAFAVAMDIDAAGLSFLKNMTPPAGFKTEEELAAIIHKCGELPFIVKGIMTVKGALKAKKAGAGGIVVSNHGGRVLDQCPATAEVLPGIAEAVGQDMTILVDGGIRSGCDVLKALALGADAVMIARPFVTAVFGGGKEGVGAWIDKIGTELKDAMGMCGVHSLEEIDNTLIWN